MKSLNLSELFNEFHNFAAQKAIECTCASDVIAEGDISNDKMDQKEIENLEETSIFLLENSNNKQEKIYVLDEFSLLDKEFNSVLHDDKDAGTPSNNFNYQQFNERFLSEPITNQSTQNEHEIYAQTQNIFHMYETEFEDSFQTVSGTRSNTESFSELRFSVSETHSEFNYSDSDSRTSPELEVPKKIEQLSLAEKLPNMFYYPPNTTIDDTTGILYEMSKQINKVPELLIGLKRPISEASISNSDVTNNSGGTLEEGVYSCFSHCDNFTKLENNYSRGQDELENLEAAVERMLNQVEIQENLLKKDLSFVPLVLEKKEVKAFPLLMNTLCLSPPVYRKQLPFSCINKRERKLSYLSKKSNFSSEPELALYEHSFENKNKDGPANYSIRRLEQSVNRLLNEVEKEEERLGLISPISEAVYNSPISTTDMSSEDDSFSVWWEGAYRSLPRHPARRMLAKPSTNNRNKLKHNISNPSQLECMKLNNNKSTNMKVTNTSKSKLLVKTTENGKSALEIRTCNNVTEFPSIEGDMKFCKMFKKTQSQAFSSWNRSLPSLQDNMTDLSKSFFGSVGSDDSINYIKYIQPSDCIQYFIPCPSMTLDSAGYCTWSDRISGGKNTTLSLSYSLDDINSMFLFVFP